MFMCFDTETDKLPIKRKKNGYINYDFSNVNLEQISYILFDYTDINKITKTYNSYVNYLDEELENNFQENPITHITLEQIKNGKNIINVLNDFYNDIKDIDIIIAHNSQFDIELMKSLALRNKNFKLFHKLKNINIFDTMKYGGCLGLNLINKPFIKLEDLYEIVIKNNKNDVSLDYNKDIKTKHEALDDTIHCYKCFLYILNNIGKCEIIYNNEKIKYKELYKKKDKEFIKKCLYCNHYTKNRMFINYCMLKTGIYDNSILNEF